MRRFLRLLVCSAALSLAAAPAAPAQERDLRIRDYHAKLAVHPDGAVDVTETLLVRFTGTWNGIYRDLSLQHRTAQGWSRRLKVTGLGATDADGRALESWDEDGDDGQRRLRIRVPGAQDAERTVVIRYRVHNAIRFYYEDAEAGDFDELYWNVTGNDWGYPIDRASARVVLPRGVSALRSAVYTGYEGAHGFDATIADGADGVRFATSRTLEPGEGLTVAVGWTVGAIASRPSAASMRRYQALRKWPLGLPFLAFFFGLRQWRQRGRDPKEEAIVVQYEPPDALSPAELGTLVDHSAELRDITATVVDLAVRGHLGIEEEVTSRVLGLLKTRDYVFHLRHPDELAELAPHESRFVAALAAHATGSGRSWSEVRAALAAAGGGGGGPPAGVGDERETEVVRLSGLQEKFYTALPGIRDAIYDRLVERGYYVTRPDRVTARWMGLGVGVLVAGVGAGIAVGAMALEWVSAPALIAAGVASGALLLLFGSVMPARTERGARTREAALGFREFLKRVESDRYRRMVTTPALFERYLPHAMAFGVADRWAKAFEGIYQEAPEWYAGGTLDGFRASSFTSDLVRMNSTAESSFSSSPSSSGSGGGGSSGGGSGGGGGGGW